MLKEFKLVSSTKISLGEKIHNKIRKEHQNLVLLKRSNKVDIYTYKNK